MDAVGRGEGAGFEPKAKGWRFIGRPGLLKAMRLPTITGLIRRRLLVNFRADSAVVEPLLPKPFRPKLHRGRAIVGVCLIRLEEIRPLGWPRFVGVASENAAHRIAVTWTDERGGGHEGVFIPRRDSSSLLNRLLGGRVFPGEHYSARFDVTDDGSLVALRMGSADGEVRVNVTGRTANELPASSGFSSLAEASAYFEGGSLGYSVTRNSSRLDGLTLQTKQWRVSPLSVSEITSSFFDDRRIFPEGTIQFDHALIMRDVPHEWHKADDLDIVA